MEETGKRTDRKSQGMRSQFFTPLDVDDGLDAAVSGTDKQSSGFGQDASEEVFPDDMVKIRDAATDKTIVSVTEAQSVRNAANQLMNDFDSVVKIRDAATDKTIVSVTEAQSVRDAANQWMMGESSDDMVKIRDAMTDKTIVSVTEAKSVRDAARSIDWRDALPEEDPLEGLVIPKEPETVSYEEEEDRFDPEEFVDQEEPDYTGEDPYEEDTGYIERERRRDSYDRRAVQKNRTSYERDDRRSRQYRDSYYDRYDDYRDNGYYDNRRRNTDYSRTKSPLRFIPLVLVIALCVFAFIAARSICFDTPMNASDYSKIKYEVTENTTNASLAQDLLNLGLIDNPLVFRLRCFFYSAKYVPGEYELSPSYSTEKIINILSGYQYGEEK